MKSFEHALAKRWTRTVSAVSLQGRHLTLRWRRHVSRCVSVVFCRMQIWYPMGSALFLTYTWICILASKGVMTCNMNNLLSIDVAVILSLYPTHARVFPTADMMHSEVHIYFWCFSSRNLNHSKMFVTVLCYIDLISRCTATKKGQIPTADPGHRRNSQSPEDVVWDLGFPWFPHVDIGA